MKRIKLLTTVIGVLAAVTLLNSCFFKEPGTSIKFNDILIEIEQATRQGDANTKDTRQYEIVFDGQSTKDSLKINLVAAPQNEDIVVRFEVAPGGDASGTTAVAGVHYRITSPEVIIPAGQNFGWLKFEVNDDVLTTTPSQFVAIRINLASTTKGRLSENYKTHRIVLGGKCTYIQSRFTGNYSVLEPGYGTYPATLTAESNPNRVTTDNFWDVGASVTYEFNPANNQVTIIGTTFVLGVNTYNVTSNGPGTMDPCTGNFTAPYTVRLGATIGSGAVLDQNTHTYTKQ